MPVNSALALKTWNRYQFARDNGHSQFIKKADKCERFFAGDQWDPEDIAKLKHERRPALTINKILPTVGTVMGEQIKNRAEISFQPRNGSDPALADTLTKVFKEISDDNQLNWLRSEMFDDGVITSRGFLDVRMDFQKSMQGKVRYTALNPKNVVIDADGEEMDPDTWGEVFTTKWVTADDIAVLYNKADAEILRIRRESTFSSGYDSIASTRDRFGLSSVPGYSDMDLDNSRNIRLIDHQYRQLTSQKFFVNPKNGDRRAVPEGWDDARIKLVIQQFGFQVIKQPVRRIRWTVIADNVVLHDDWSPYEHFTVVPYFPYFRHGKTIGLVENLLDPQELLNKTTSQELHIINSSANGGWKLKTGTLTNMSVEELEQNGAKTGLVIEVNGDPEKDIVKIQPNTVPQGIDRMTYKAEEHIKGISNVSDSQMGQDRADVAAKAIQEKKQSSQVTLVKPLDNLTRSDYFLARATLCLVQTYYTEERLITYTHDRMTGATSTMQVNQMTPEGVIINDLSMGEYEVVVTSVPVKDTLEDGQFDQIVALKEMGIDIPEDVLIEASRLQNKKQILEKMAARAQSPEAQQQAQLQMQMLQAEVEKVKAEVEKIHSEAQLKSAASQHTLAKAQKESMPDGDGGDEAAMKGMAEGQKINLAREKVHGELSIKRDELSMKAQLEQQKAQAEEKRAQEQAVADRLARANPTPPKGA